MGQLIRDDYSIESLKVIKKATEVSGQGNIKNGVTQNSHSIANNSLARLFRKNNPIRKRGLIMPDIKELTEQLERECYNYPPNLEKMKKLVDMGADVNAVYNDYQTLLGHILNEYLERVVTMNYTKDLQMGTALICDTLCRGELINGRNGRYLDSIVRFFFENGFDMKKKFMCEGKETLYANDILAELENVFHGPEAIKTLKYILSFVESPDELYDTGEWPIFLAYSSSGCFDYFDMDLPRYGCCEYKAARIVNRFIAKKGWKDKFMAC